MPAYRAPLLRFAANGEPLYDSDGLLVTQANAQGVQQVLDAGPYQAVAARHPQLQLTQHWPDRLIVPGFIDMHVHYPQLDVIGAPADGLLPCWSNTPSPPRHALPCPHTRSRWRSFSLTSCSATA